MTKIFRAVLLLAVIFGTAEQSLALIHKVKYHEHPALRRHRAEKRADKAAKKMAYKRPLFGG